MNEDERFFEFCEFLFLYLLLYVKIFLQFVAFSVVDLLGSSLCPAISTWNNFIQESMLALLSPYPLRNNHKVTVFCDNL